MIGMGSQADPKFLRAAAEAHDKGSGSASGACGVASQEDWKAENAALGRVIASVTQPTVRDVYNSVSAITDSDLPAYLKSTVNGATAEKAYSVSLPFQDVVKKTRVSLPGAAAAAPSGDRIGAAAKKLSDASYPFLKSVDWTYDIYLKPLPGVSRHWRRGGRERAEGGGGGAPQGHRQHRRPAASPRPPTTRP